MLERVLDYPGYLIRFRPERPSKRTILLLHGFPANKNLKNLDIAYLLHQKLEANIYIVHYQGLGESPGEFLFTRSIMESIAVIDRITSQDSERSLELIGHSWGGLVAVNALKERASRLRHVILLSPLCYADRQSPLREWLLNEVRVECPGVYGNQTQATIARDFEIIIDHHLPTLLAPTLEPSIPITIIQAKNDDTTPPERTGEFAKRLTRPPNYLELDDDHSFMQDRRRLADVISKSLAVCSF